MRSGSQCSHLEPGGGQKAEGADSGFFPGHSQALERPAATAARSPRPAPRAPSAWLAPTGAWPRVLLERRSPWRPRSTPCAASRRPPRPEAGRRALRRCRQGTPRSSSDPTNSERSPGALHHRVSSDTIVRPTGCSGCWQ